ncbi:thermonuclease family protein [Ensifer sp. T173]|uniref:Thermonuclease family protein n=1 Tax=Ensifer canadensis TaxID=555315 RepID=A0AAW4FK70_9HYPH|nr:thermonuclease family protein [Ensifer canadensis]MBM3092448.1 thermonuclease family protein [Ensifer canadensis]UBI73986.1 thermonuclease family protein [Ensifer canadensis]
MKWFMVVLAGLISVCPAFAEDAIVGRAAVVDGDTIEIAGERIRLLGVDAPESWQVCEDGDGLRYRCGQEAAMTLDRFLQEFRPTRCETVERDRYGRFVGVCFRADGVEVNRWLVESGLAVDWSRYSGGAYADAQDKARGQAVGIWQGAFQLPCEARAQRSKQTSAC